MTDDTSILRDLEEALWQPETRFDRQWMDGVLADDFAELGRSGTAYTREMVINAEPYPFEVDFPLADFGVTHITENLAVVHYRSVAKFESGVEHGLRLSVWIRVDGKWRLRFRQGLIDRDI